MSNNIVLVTVDSLRADHCSFMGSQEQTTPALDSMADQGTAFRNTIAPGPRTPESMPAIFTGEFLPTDLSEAMESQQTVISDHMQSLQTLPEMLSRQGYDTIGFTPNPFTSRFFNFDQGFDQYQDFISGDQSSLYERVFENWIGGSTVSQVMRLARNMILREEVFKPWEAFYDDVVKRVSNASEPYFLWIFLMDVHEPYLAGDGYKSLSAWERWNAIWRLFLGDRETPFDDQTVNRLKTAYDDSIRYTDAFFDKLMTDLQNDDPIYIVHGDHGEAFGEHGYYSHEPYLYEESIHVPLVVSEDVGLPADTPLSLRQLPELVTALASDVPATGRTLDHLDQPYAVAKTTAKDAIAVRSNDWKYIQTAEDGVLLDIQNNETAIENEPLTELADSIATNAREHVVERARISKAGKAGSQEFNL